MGYNNTVIYFILFWRILQRFPRRYMRKKEIERILAELSAQCAAHKEDIGEDYTLLILLDTIFARGQLSLKMGGQPARPVGTVPEAAGSAAPPAG